MIEQQKRRRNGDRPPGTRANDDLSTAPERRPPTTAIIPVGSRRPRRACTRRACTRRPWPGRPRSDQAG